MMLYCFGELKQKEIVDINTGEKLGFVDDLEFDDDSKNIVSLIAYGRARFFGFFGHEEDVVIPCASIRLIGKDTILVCLENEEKTTKHHKFTIESLYK